MQTKKYSIDMTEGVQNVARGLYEERIKKLEEKVEHLMKLLLSKENLETN